MNETGALYLMKVVKNMVFIQQMNENCWNYLFLAADHASLIILLIQIYL